MTNDEIKQYTHKVIPNIEKQLSDRTKTNEERLELYNLYVEVLRMVAPLDFISFNKYLELDENHNDPNKAFYFHRKKHLADVFDALNDMEVYDKYDYLIVEMPPRVGKTTTGIRFMAWIGGKYPENTELCTSYSDNITTSFYNGVSEITLSDRFKEVFPNSPIIDQNAKREEIWLRVKHRYPTLMFVPVGGSMTGRSEASKYLYCDDLVSGYEEAVSVTRMEKLWNLYDINCRQRKKDGCKEIHVATPWSVHDVVSRLASLHDGNERCKIVKIPCFDENGESQFDFPGGFSTKYYTELRDTMEEASFSALYMQEPIEREGILYHKEDLAYYFELPEERPDTIISVCDSKNLGKDYVCSPVGYVYGDTVYVADVVYNSGLPDVTRPLVAQTWLRNKVVRGDVEMNNGGNYFAEDLDSLIKKEGGKTSIRTFFTGNNKTTKIITYADYVKKHFVFKHPSTYSAKSEYGAFVSALLKWTQTGNNKHDDAPDGIAMLAQLAQELSGCYVKILSRRELRL